MISKKKNNKIGNHINTIIWLLNLHTIDSIVDMTLKKLCKNTCIDNWKFVIETVGCCWVMICNDENILVFSSWFNQVDMILQKNKNKR